MGEVVPKGHITFKGESSTGLESHQISQRGLGYVPEHRNIFPTMTVRENLILGIKDMKHKGCWSIDEFLDRFPNLKARADTAAGVLSGGEKQMLTMSRTLMGDPDLVIIDEPTEGLAPKIVHQVGDMIASIAKAGVAIMLLEQKLSIALRIADKVYVMGHGEIVYTGTPKEFLERSDIRAEWLEV
jgi:branched-chain amino acid transport system ATP-binding protein